MWHSDGASARTETVAEPPRVVECVERGVKRPAVVHGIGGEPYHQPVTQRDLIDRQRGQGTPLRSDDPVLLSAVLVDPHPAEPYGSPGEHHRVILGDGRTVEDSARLAQPPAPQDGLRPFHQ